MGGVQRELGIGGKGVVVCHARLLPLSQFDEKIGRDEVCCGRWEGVERERGLTDVCSSRKDSGTPFPNKGAPKLGSFYGLKPLSQKKTSKTTISTTNTHRHQI